MYQSVPTWEVLYSVKEAYGSLVDPLVTDASAELTPAFWHDLTVLFENNDDVYQTWYARRGMPDVEEISQILPAQGLARRIRFVS